MHVCPPPFKYYARANRMHRVDPRGLQQGTTLKCPRFRITPEFLHIWNPQKEFQQPSSQFCLRFLISRRLPQRLRLRNFSIQPAQNIFHHRSLPRPHRILPMLRPITRSAFSFRLEDLHSSNTDLRKHRRFLLRRAQSQHRFRQQQLFSSAVIHKKHSVPRWQFRLRRSRRIRNRPPLRLAHIPHRKRVFQQPRKLLHLFGRQFLPCRFFRRRIQHPRRHRRPRRRKFRIVPQRQQGISLPRLCSRHPAPDHIEQSPRRHLRRLQRSLCARRVYPSCKQQRRN